MKFLVVCVVITLFGLYLFRKTFHHIPATVKGWMGWIIAVALLVGWFCLLIWLR